MQPTRSRDGQSVTRRAQLELAFIVIVALVLFGSAITLPTERWLRLVLENHTYVFDELIFVFVVLSFVLPFYSIRRWRDLRHEVASRVHAVDQLEHSAHISAQLSQMTNLLHSCVAGDEASKVVSHYARQLFPEMAGALYVFRNSRNLLELAADWNQEKPQESMFAPQQCWALRQGQIYDVHDPRSSIACPHVTDPRPYICLPMMAHGEVLALLFMQTREGADGGAVPPRVNALDRALLRVFSEHISLALSNLRLREALRQQSIRDPLTGLFNRRYLEESLALEVARAKRGNQPFSVIMMDLDHFKRFNDTHGHNAGDAVLQALGGFLQRQVRGGDIACRYGGEEFTLVLPGASLEVAQKRAVQLCEGVRALPVDFKSQSLGPLSLSAGVAMFPIHGETAESIVQAADAALYQAKNAGRDQVAIAS